MAALEQAGAAATGLGGQVALVTGASGGIGHAVAVALAEAGADVAVLGRSPERLDAVVAEVRARDRAAYRLVGDVTVPDQVRTLIEQLERIDVLVTCAGANVPQPFVDVLPQTFEDLFRVNVRGAFFVSQAFVRKLLARGAPGSIVHVSSQMGHVGAAQRTVYCATKHAVEGMTRAMAVELAPHGIRVNAVAPTYVMTPMTEPFFAEREFLADALSRIPLGRVGEAGDVARAAVFLASPAAALITGTSLVVDGGYTAQ